MASILSGFDTVQQALAAQQYALSITQRNVANANNPAYARQVVVFNPDAPSGSESSIPGVYLQASRDRFLDYGIGHELQSLGKSNVTSDALQQIDAVFNQSGGLELQQAISNFFGSFTRLTSSPEDTSLRQQVLSSANGLADTFHRLYSGAQRVQISQNSAVKYTLDEINSLTSRIADLNQKVQIARADHSEDEFTLRDSRQQLLEQLSGLVDLSYFETDSGSVTVMTRQSGLLVLENQSHTFSTVPSSSGFAQIMLDGVDVTSSLESGKLGGLLQLRDDTIPGYLASLDEMAATLISRVNAQHALGSDLEGSPGGEFFAPWTNPASQGAARAISVALTDPDRIAAAEAGAAEGNNINARLIAAIADEKLFSSGSETTSQFYAGLVYRIGSDWKEADQQVLYQNDLLDRLKNQRDGLSGVNLDEEAINIIQYQKAYQASARYANTLELLSDEIIQLLGA